MTYNEKLGLFILAQLDKCEYELIQAENNFTKFRRLPGSVGYQYGLDVLLAQHKLDSFHDFADLLRQFMNIKDTYIPDNFYYRLEVVVDGSEPFYFCC